MKNKRKAYIWLLSCIILIIFFTILATYAFYNIEKKEYGGFNVNISSKGVDTLISHGSKPIFIEANIHNFTMGFGHNVVGSTLLDVSLDTTNSKAAYCYELEVTLPDEVIFQYSKPNKPELVLNIAKSTDNKNYVDIIKDLDITTKTGKIKVPTTQNGNDYVHHLNTTKNKNRTDYWKASLTLVWYSDIDQSINDNKSYDATVKANVLVEC